ncbi:MAG: GHKL domain-containing protein [Clostridia bacterium]|nr:GHKL domain-containing protein [Clostridia bacterium]
MLLTIVLINKERTNRIITNFWKFTGKGIKALILLTLFISGILSVVLSYIPEIHSFDIWYRLLSFLFVIIIIAACLIYPICISNIITKNYYKTINAVTSRQLKTQIEYYNVLNDKTRDLRVFKHNFKNTLIVLETHLKNNDLESAKKFINKSNNQLDYLNTFNTGSYILDALLFEKRRIANLYNIELEFSGSINQEIIDDIDLCIIFGNSIDNAIEACQKLNNEIQQIINIKIRHLNNLVNIIITNPTLEHINTQENIMSTTKSDVTNHGFGLESIYNIVEKYSGDAGIYYKDNLFTLNIVIPTN